MARSRSKTTTDEGLSRRSFLQGTGLVAAGGVAGAAARDALAQQAGPERLSGTVELALRINGESKRVRVEPRTTLLNALRNHCEPPLTGAKLVCDHGSCGACTVHLDGKPVYACMLLTADAVGREVTTIEGLSKDGELTPLQRAFCEHDASMCGFCTPGFVMALSACLARTQSPQLAEMKEACAGNLCRCGTYPQIFQAAVEASRRAGLPKDGAGAPKEGGR